MVPDLSVTEDLRTKGSLLSEAAYRSRRLSLLSGMDKMGLYVQGQWDAIAQGWRLLQAVLSLLGMMGRKPATCLRRAARHPAGRGRRPPLASVLRLSSVIRVSGGVREARQLSALKEDDLRRTEESLRLANGEAAGLEAELARASVPKCPVHGVALACPLCGSNSP